jgi:hypothetical protein
MSKQQTKRNKRKTKNQKTKKYYGGAFEEKKKTNGVFDIISDKLSNYTNNVAGYVSDKGLRLLGLQPIKEAETVADVNVITPETNFISPEVVKVFDKGSAALIGQINNVLGSPEVETSITEAADKTAEIGERLLTKVNDTISTPEMKEQTKEVLDNVSDYAEIAVESMDEPINKAVDELNKAGTKAASGIATGVIKVGTDAMAAIPGIGAIIELGKMANDVSAAAGDVVEAASDATSTISNVIEESSKNINEGVAELAEKKKEATEISNRTNQSLESFENPIVTKGGRKTRRKNRTNMKSKRVRFFI